MNMFWLNVISGLPCVAFLVVLSAASPMEYCLGRAAGFAAVLLLMQYAAGYWVMLWYDLQSGSIHVILL